MEAFNYCEGLQGSSAVLSKLLSIVSYGYPQGLVIQNFGVAKSQSDTTCDAHLHTVQVQICNS